MARVRSTARVSREGDKTEVTETTPILEVMKRSGLVVTEEATAEGATAETEQALAEDGTDSESEEDNSILSPMKPSHIEFGRSTVTAEDLVVMKKMGYFGEMTMNWSILLRKK
jgi:UDP-N-acetyl-D-mannosaminuronate dehydrogenase